MSRISVAKISKDPFIVPFDGIDRQDQMLGDFAVGPAIGHETQNFQFTLSQGVNYFGWLIRRLFL